MSLSMSTDEPETSLIDNAIGANLICCLMFTLPIIVISQTIFSGLGYRYGRTSVPRS